MTEIFPLYRPPDWYPLQRALTAAFGVTAAEASRSFWFIGYLNGPVDVGELRQYEHTVTRRRLVLDREGSAFRFDPTIGRYVRMDDEAALIEALR